MQVAPIHIYDEDVEKAENILLDSGQHFDSHSQDFIKNFHMIDLQAVPGSGKTTALLAKLLISDNNLPFADNSGILAISHTNAAVDQIVDRIGRYCPKLFAYPNFVGTMQTFVDRFLAIPYFAIRYGRTVCRIDDDIYNEGQYTPKIAKKWLVGKKGETYLYGARLSKDGHLIPRLDADTKLPKLNPDTAIYKALVSMKKKVREQGILSYDDAYILADEYIEKYPQIVGLIRSRFRYVFVDEMQDMAKHQCDILERLFYYESANSRAFQRIGDINQAIFGRVKSDNVWCQREDEMRKTLPGSYRLSKHIARVVRHFGIEDVEIESLNSKSNLKPHVIVYDDRSITHVIPRFAKLVVQYQHQGELPSKPNHAMKAIGWIKEKEEEDRFAISNYYPGFESNEHSPRQDYKGLIDYLNFYEKKGLKSLRFIRKGILHGLLKILRLENVLDSNDRNYSVNSLLNEIRLEASSSFYEDFKLRLFNWSKKVYREESDAALKDIRDYLPVLLTQLNEESEMNESTRLFIDQEAAQQQIDSKQSGPHRKNLYESDGVSFEIGTVHSAKGETHTATLYLECFYYGKYESEYLNDCFKDHYDPILLTRNGAKRKKEAAKMAYVGFSRPTHLLCFAVHKDRLGNIADSANWIIVRDLIEK